MFPYICAIAPYNIATNAIAANTAAPITAAATIPEIIAVVLRARRLGEPIGVRTHCTRDTTNKTSAIIGTIRNIAKKIIISIFLLSEKRALSTPNNAPIYN